MEPVAGLVAIARCPRTPEGVLMHEHVILWRRRGPEGEVRCTLTQIGEGGFELRLWAESALLLAEVFDDEARLLARAEALERERTEVHS